jgi:hypothetical protein
MTMRKKMARFDAYHLRTHMNLQALQLDKNKERTSDASEKIENVAQKTLQIDAIPTPDFCQI